MLGPRVLFVSRPVVAPFRLGAVRMVRDLACALRTASATVMVTSDAPPLGADVACDPVYRAGERLPVEGARLLGRLVTRDAHQIWHFVGPANAPLATMARVAKRARALTGWRGPIVQTVAGVPESFEGIGRFVFGDAVVVMSEWMRGRMLGAGVSGRAMRVIPPCAAPPVALSADERAVLRRQYDLGDGPIVLYPGSYEASRAAELVARSVPAVRRADPRARVVFACPERTGGAGRARRRIHSALADAGLAESVRHVGDDDVDALLRCASVVVFPVDDLEGELDLPCVLLQALACGVPLVLSRGGSLEALDAAAFVDPGDDARLAAEIVALLQDASRAAGAADRGRRLYEARYRPELVAAEYERLYESLLSRR